MQQQKSTLLTLVLFSLFPLFLMAQGPDCSEALVICNSGAQDFNPSGPGNNDFANGNNNDGCLTGEHQSAWYYFEFQDNMPPNSVITFVINPNAGPGQDYDFAIFGPDVNCDALGSPVRCSYAGSACGFCPQTGLGNGTTDVSEGAGGDGFVSAMTVQPGQGFFLLIDNFISSSTGFQLTWGGSAAPFLDCTANPNCNLMTNAGPDMTICAGTTTFQLQGSAFGATASAVYTWTGTNGADIYITNPFSPNPQVILPANYNGGPITYTLTVVDGSCMESNDVVINFGAGPVVNISGDLSICNGQTTILTANGAGIVSYQWSNGGGSNQSMVVTATGTYSVTATNASGCSTVATVNVIPEAGPSTTIAGPSTLCVGGNAFLIAGAGFSNYQWSTGLGGQNTAINGPGTYSVTVTNAQGCTGTAQITIGTAPPPPVTITGNPFLCSGSTTVLSAGSGFSAYQWTPGNQATPNITINAPGTYSVTVQTAAGCLGMDDITIFPAPSPVPIISGNLNICPGSSTTLTAQGSGFTSYAWSVGGSGSSVSVNTPGNVSVTVTNSDGCQGVATVTVNQVTPPTPMITGDLTLCQGQVSALSVGSGYSTYMWSNSGNGSAIAIDAPGVYSVTVTNAAGCPASTSVTVTPEPNPTTTITGDLTICPGQPTTLSAGAGFSNYSWSPSGGTGQSATVTATGTYTVTFQNSQGCTGTQSATVTAAPVPSPTISGDDTICPGASSTLSAQSGFATYSWSTSSVTSQTTVNTPGTVFLTVTNSEGCPGTTSFTVSQLPSPTPVISGDLSICQGDTTALSVAGSFPTINWSTGGTGSSVQVSTPGNIGVTVTDASGCTGSSTANLVINNLPVVNITGDNAICPGESTTLSAGPGFSAYQWSNNASINSSISVSTGGDYSVTVTDANGCQNSDDFTVTANPAPTVQIAGSLSFCNDGSTTLSVASGFTSYNWSNGNNTSSVTIDQPGNIGVTVTDANGCTASTSVTVQQLTQLQPAVSGVLSICPGESTTLDAGAGYASYLWSPGNSNTQQITTSTPGVYSLTVTDAAGCSGSTSVNISQFTPPSPQITGALSYCAGTSTTLSAGSGYQNYAWSTGDSLSTAVISNPGGVTVTVTDANGCTGTDAVSVAALDLPTPEITGALNFCPNTSTLLSAGNTYSAYSWSIGGTASSVTVTSPGSVVVTVTDANGCQGSDVVQVGLFNTTIPAINGNLQFCPNTNNSLTVAGAYVDYSWSTSDNTQSITVDTPGNVGVTVTDANGCITENSVDLTLYQVTPPAIQGPGSFCTGSPITLNAAAGYVAYTWTGGSSASSLVVSDQGDYGVTATDVNGCISSSSVSIIEHPLPEVQIGGSSTYCIGSFTTLNSGTTYSSYNWSTGFNTPTITVNTPGTVGLTVTDNFGCVGSASLNVIEATELTPIITGDLAYCIGNNTSLNAGAGFAIYQWSTMASSQSITVNTPGSYSVTVSDGMGCSGSTTVQVVQNPLPTPAIAGLAAYCEGASTSLDATNAAYTDYHWSTGALNPSITVSQPGVIGVTVTDNNGCIGTTSLNVIENPLPVFDITGDTYFCTGDAAVLNATPGYANYQWSNSTNGQTTSVNTPGQVNLTVTSAAGCVSSSSVLITQIQLPIANAGNAFVIDCNNESVTLGGTGSSQGAQFQYNWSGPGISAANANFPNPEVFVPGSYSLTIIDTTHNCQSQPSAANVADMRQAPTAVANVSSQLTCDISTVVVSGAGSATGANITYQWYTSLGDPIPGATSINYSATEVDTYSLTVTNQQTGCTSTASSAVTEDREYPTAEAGLPQHLNCYDPTASLNGGSSSTGPEYSYQWNAIQGHITVGFTSLTPTVDQPGSYRLVVTNNDNGCESEDIVNVTQDIQPPVVDAGQTQELNCVNTVVTLDGSNSSNGPSFTYEWQFGNTAVGTDLEIEVDKPGNYTLEVTNTINGCSETDVVVITINNDRPTDMSLATQQPICFGDQNGSIAVAQVVGGQTPYLYSLNGEPFTGAGVFSQLGAGLYTVLVQDATGCELTTEVLIPDGNDLHLDLGEDQFIKLGEEAGLQAQINIDPGQIEQFTWQTNNWMTCLDCPDQVVRPFETVTFTATLADVNGCSTYDRVTVYVDRTKEIFVPSAFSPNGDGTNDVLMVFSGPDVAVVRSFQLFNRWGESIFEVFNFPPNDPVYGWDGYFRSQLYNAAVFAWFAEVEFIDGEVVLFKGDVTLMR